MQVFGLKRSGIDHLVFYSHTSPGKCAYLMIYVDDIVIMQNYRNRIS